MTDPIKADLGKIQSTAVQAEQDAKSAALNQLNKQEGWMKRNAKALIIGLVVGAVLGWLARAIL